MAIRFAVLLDSQQGGSGDDLCATFVGETLAQCLALDGETHDGGLKPVPKRAWQVSEAARITMRDMLGKADPGVVVRLESR